MSVIYLALQIGANTKMLRSQAHYNALSLARRPFEMAIENEGFINQRRFRDAPGLQSGGSGCDAATTYLWSSTPGNICTHQHRDGSIPKELWVGAPTRPSGSRWGEGGHARFFGRNRRSRSTGGSRSDVTRTAPAKRKLRRRHPITAEHTDLEQELIGRARHGTSPVPDRTGVKLKVDLLRRMTTARQVVERLIASRC